MAPLGLSLVSTSGGSALGVACGLLAVAASCCGAPTPGVLGFSSCGAPAYLLRGAGDLPGPGAEPMPPAPAGGFLVAGPPGKPS